jgi:hypothetical protein
MKHKAKVYVGDTETKYPDEHSIVKYDLIQFQNGRWLFVARDSNLRRLKAKVKGKWRIVTVATGEIKLQRPKGLQVGDTVIVTTKSCYSFAGSEAEVVSILSDKYINVKITKLISNVKVNTSKTWLLMPGDYRSANGKA